MKRQLRFLEDLEIQGEEWRPVAGREVRYRVSSTGRIMSIKGHRGGRRIGMILAQSSDRDGYRFVNLCCDGIPRRTPIHRIVCAAFHKNPKALPQVNHINGMKFDNGASNLEWCTPQENTIHAIETGLKVERFGDERHNTKIKTRDIDAIKARFKSGEKQRSIAQAFGVHQSLISLLVRNKRRPAAHSEIAQ